MNTALQAKLATLPRSPGVYFHKSASGEIIYVGKAAVLRNRVRQYFQSKKDFDAKTLALVAEIDDTDWLETESEIDALFLESEMVKRYMPRYNILLRDDKSQTYVRIDMKSEWPHVSFTRNPADDAAEYYGPFYNGLAVKKALRYLRRVFPYYTRPVASDGRPDFDVHLGLSPGSDMTSVDYKANLRRLIAYIKGGRVAIVNELEKEMKAAAVAQEFERAAQLRNRLGNLRELQRRIMFGDREFLDISKDRALSELTEILGLTNVPARIEGYDISHMSGTNVVASMVVFTNGVSNRAEYRKFKMSRERNDDVANIYETVTRRLSERNVKSWGLPDLLLIDGGKGQLDVALRAIEERGLVIPCIGIAKREEEIIVHRIRSSIGNLEPVRASTLPNVAVIDEGEYAIINLHAGQRNASAHSKNLRGSSTSTAYSDVVKLFQRIRDESHRFAVSYHTSLKRAGQTKSVLDEIPGVGPATRKKLLKVFGSVRGVTAASQAELVVVVGPVLAVRLKAALGTRDDVVS